MENFEKAEHAVEVWRYLSTSETGVLSAPDIKMIKLSTSAQELQRILPVTRSQSYGGNKKRKEKTTVICIYSHQKSTTSAAGRPEPEQMWREEWKVRRRERINSENLKKNHEKKQQEIKKQAKKK